MREMGKLHDLKENWDHYHAPTIDRATTDSAIYSILSLASVRPEVPPPQIVPTPLGGVQLEWHQRGIHLEVEFDPDGMVSVFFKHGKTRREGSPTKERLASSPEVQEAMVALLA